MSRASESPAAAKRWGKLAKSVPPCVSPLSVPSAKRCSGHVSFCEMSASYLSGHALATPGHDRGHSPQPPVVHHTKTSSDTRTCNARPTEPRRVQERSLGVPGATAAEPHDTIQMPVVALKSPKQRVFRRTHWRSRVAQHNKTRRRRPRASFSILSPVFHVQCPTFINQSNLIHDPQGPL